MIRLSILICSTHTRRNTFLPKIMDQVYGQYEALTPDQQSQVEILVLQDNKKMMLGEKRNRMVEMSQGDYYVFVDDDDRIEPDYISSLLSAAESVADVITFLASVSIDGNPPKICRYSKDYDRDYNTSSEYHRLPNHICCVKRSVGRQVSFPNISRGEDSAYSKILKPLLQSQHHIDRVLYHYDFSTQTTETQEHLRSTRLFVRKDVPAVSDVIILSNAKDERLFRMTSDAIGTCIRGANGLSVNIIVVEQNRAITYGNAQTIHRVDGFNYNRYANAGAHAGKATHIVIANNDLIFHDGWLHNLLAANHPLVSPKCPNDPRQRDIRDNATGTVNGRHLSGWCFMIQRSLWERMNGFDEDVSFWFSDDCTIEQARIFGVEPMLVPSSVVRHLGSSTLHSLDPETMDDYTWGQVDIFNSKYGKDKFANHPRYLEWKSRQKEAV